MPIIKINHDIPRTMTLEGLEYLGRLAQSVPKNGVIVEVGPLFGSSTWVLAKNAHPSVTVYSIDTWEPQLWIAKIEAKFPNCKPFSLDAFKHYIQDCPNVIPIQGWSPDIVQATWNRPIDLFFDDASHGNPGFINNINFFEPFIKPLGIICGDDYASGWPDIVREVDNLGQKWHLQPEIAGRVWAMRKPYFEKNITQTVYDSLELDIELPQLSAIISTKQGLHTIGSPNCWAGAMHKSDTVQTIQLSWKNPIAGLSAKIQYHLSNSNTTDWIIAGQTYHCPDNIHITGATLKLTGAVVKDFKLNYQLGFTNITKAKSYVPNSKSAGNGQPIDSGDPNLAMNAVRIGIARKNA